MAIPAMDPREKLVLLCWAMVDFVAVAVLEAGDAEEIDAGVETVKYVVLDSIADELIALVVPEEATSLTVGGPAVSDTLTKPLTTDEITPVIPLRVNRFEKLVTVPPDRAVDIIPRKLKFISVNTLNRILHGDILCICTPPPTSIGTTTATVFPAVAYEPVPREYSSCGESLDPVYSNKWYAVRSARGGARPESFQAMVKSRPPGREALAGAL
jgi:hypothetical protein